MGVAHGHGKPGAPQDGKIDDVVPHVSHLAGAESRRVQDLLQNGQLVQRALVEPLHPELAGPMLHDAGLAPREEHHLDSGPPDHLETVSVADVEALGLLPVIADDDAAVGEDPVHIEDEHFHLRDLVGQSRSQLCLEVHYRPFFMSFFTSPSIPLSVARRPRRESSASEFGPSHRARSGSG